MKIKLFTDGACSGNPGPGGAAFVMLVDNIQTYECAGGYRLTTNNRMEITAVITALKCAKSYISSIEDNNPDEEIIITVLTDSQNIIGTMNEGWRRKKNTDLWQKLDSIVEATRESGITVNFLKVQAHHNVKFNEQADRLAVKACKNPQFTDQVYEKTQVDPNNLPF